MEFEKLFLKSEFPSLGIRWLEEIGRLKEILPEIYDLIGVSQPPNFHPEGDVFEHTMQALDAAAVLSYENNREKLIIMYGALCHDIGKPETTKKIKGKWTSYGHAEVGASIAKKLLKRITHNSELITAVCKLVHYHMLPRQFIKEGAKPPAYKRLARKLAPEVTMIMLAKVSLADIRGRNGKSSKPLKIKDPAITAFLKKAKRLDVATNIEEPILHGRDIMDIVPPGPAMGKLLNKAYEIQIEEGIKDKNELKRRLMQKK
jgi:tRNA nucleotidyltransferase (CCA-adding enzyme)